MATGTDRDTLKVTMEDINKVTEQLGPDELKLLYDNLGIDHIKVEHAEASAGTNDTILKARAVLRQWLHNKGSAATQEALFTERDKILKRRRGKTRADTDEPQMQVQITPWLGDEDAREMEAIFVNLEMEKGKNKASRIKEKHFYRNEDLLTLQTDTGLRVNRIIIHGEAGSGKSTLLNNIAYKWAKNLGTNPSQSCSSPLSQFDLVFLISINEIDYEHKNDSLEEIIFEQILEEASSVSQPGLKSYLISHSERCLFLVDGIDEDSVGILNSTTSEMSKLIYYNKIYRNSCVIASSRPDTLKSIGRNIKLHVFTKVNLNGFSDEHIEEYIRKHFATNNINHYAGLMRHLQEDSDVWDLAGKPLLLMLFCVLLDDPDQANRSLPNTRTKLYQETITSLWKRYHYNKHELSDDDDDELEDESQSLKLEIFLECLGKVTLEGLLDPKEERLLFNNSDFDKTTFSLALNVGILNRRKIKLKLHVTSSVRFLHKSIQDYCSAVFLANLHSSNKEKYKACIAKLMMGPSGPETSWYDRYDEVLYFCAGCKPETAKLITQQRINITDKIPDGMYLNVLKLFTLAFEAQLSHEECDELASIMSTATFPFGVVWEWYESLKAIQYQLDLLKPVTYTTNSLIFSTVAIFYINLYDGIEFAKRYSLLLSMLWFTKQIHQITLIFEFSNARNEVFDLFGLFNVLAHLTHLQSLTLDNNSETYEKIHVSNIHKLCHIKLEELYLMSITINVTSMTEFLNRNTSLKWWNISNPHDIRTYGTFRMIKAMSKHKTYLGHLLGGIAIGRAVKYLEQIIPKVTEFTLIDPCLDVWDVYKLAFYLQEAETLEKLIFIQVTFATAISSLADRLKYMKNLKVLGLIRCDLGNRESHILAGGIREMRGSLCTLDLRQNSDIGLEGRRDIKNLRFLPQFQELEIIFDQEPWESDFTNLSPTFMAEYEDTVNLHLPMLVRVKGKDLIIRPTGLKTYLELEEIRESQTADLPDCCSCMSQIYNGVTCKMINSDVHQITNLLLRMNMTRFNYIVKANRVWQE